MAQLVQNEVLRNYIITKHLEEEDDRNHQTSDGLAENGSGRTDLYDGEGDFDRHGGDAAS